MIKVKDGYAKLIGTTYKGSPDRVLLSNGGDKPLSDFATASGVVTVLGTNGNYVTWTKNGIVNNLTVPYATNADKIDGKDESDLFVSQRGLANVDYIDLTSYTSGNANYKLYDSGIYTVPRLGYSDAYIVFKSTGSTSAVELMTSYQDTARLKLRKTVDNNRVSGPWRELAFTSDIPTKVSQLTNDSGYLTSTNLTNYVTLNSNLTITGSKTFSTQLKFTVANGTAPFTVTSKTLVANLNADLLDGRNSSDYIAYKNKSINYTEGWYRIAETSVNVGNNIGIFYIYSSGPGYHTNVILGASISYTSIPTLNLLNMTQYSTMSISKARIVYNNSTYAELKAYLDVYIPLTLTSSDGSAKSIQIFVKFVGHKWSLTPIEAATVENTHTTKEISFAKNTIISDYFLGDLIGSASALTTTRKIWGLNFDGTQNVTGNMNGVGTINNRLLLDGSGNAQVHITGVTANTDYIKLQIDGGSNSNRNLVLLTDGGFVGIGTDSPLYKLHVAGTTSTNLLFIGGSSHPMIIGNGSLLSLGAANSNSKTSVVLDLNTDAFRRNSASTTISLGTAAYPWANIYGTNYYGVSHINFKGGEEHFDQYGNFWFGSSSGNWAVFSSDGNPLLKVLHNNGNTIIAGKLYAPKINLDGLSLTKSVNVLNISNSYGYILIGPQNEHHCHLYTDLPSFYTNKPILIGGKDALHTGNWSSTITKSALGLGNVQNTAFYKRVVTVNGTEWDMAGTINSTAFTIYAPSTAGTSGQVLTSSGGTPTWVDYSKISNKEAYSSFTTNKGWYRVAELTTSNAVSKNNTIISIQRSYNSPQNEHYIFAISVGFNGQININQLSGCVGGLLITKVRVVYTNSGNCYFDCHIAANTYTNLYRVHVLAGDCVSYQYPQLITDTDTVRSVEVATVNGMSSNYGFTGDLSGNATTATSSRNLSKFIISTSKSPGEDNKLNWCGASSTTNGGSGTAIDANGFPVLNNANGILWLGTHTGNYGGQLGISSNSNLYYRYASGGTFPNTWKQLAFTDSNITGNAATATNADKLDGLHKEGFQQTVYTYFPTPHNIASTTTLANILATNLTSDGDNFKFYDTKFYSSASETSNRAQIAYGYKTDGIHFRRYYNGAWTTWKQIAFTDSNVASSTITGDDTMTIIPLLHNEINFGGTNNSLKIYFGYRATDSKPIPTSFIFGGSDGSASLSASKFIKSGGTAALLLRADGNVATFNWSGQNGQPTWLWGGDTQHTYYVYNPANFSVNYATSAGNADTLDGEHGSRYTLTLGGPNYVTITVEGDAATYYPVIIKSVSNKYPMLFVNISRGYSETAPDSWNNSTHKGGLTLTLLWNGSRYWDGNGSGQTCYCVYVYESYCTMVGGLGNSTAGKVVWLRGGGAVYHIHAMNGTSVTADVHTSTYTDSAKLSFAPRTTVESYDVRWPGYSYGADKLGSSTIGGTYLPIYLSSGAATAGTSYAKAIKAITRSGTTFTYTCIDGTTGTFTQLDSNTTYPVYFKNITTGFKDAFRTQTKGDANSGNYISAIRCDTASIENAPIYSSGIAFGMSDTHGYLYTNYNTAVAYIGGGSANKLKWIKQIAFRETTLAGYGITDAVKIATKSANVSESCVGYTTADHNLQNGGLFTGLGADGNYGSQLLGNYVGTGLYYRGKNNGTWTAWKTIAFTDYVNNTITSSLGSYYTKTESDTRYVNAAGDTMTGTLTVHTGSSLVGLKFGSSYLNSLNNQLLWQSPEAIRFGSADWDWNSWAGLKYVHSSKIIYLGLADGTIFNANSALSGGKLYLPGISNAYIGNGTYKILHSGNSSVSGGGSSWGSSITVNLGGTSKTLTIPSKPSYSWTDISNKPVYSWSGSSPLDIILANYGTMATNLFISAYLSHGSGSIAMGYKIFGYESTPYGGWFGATYSSPWFIGASAGTWSLLNIITDTNYTSYTVKKDGTGASGTWGINITGNAGSVKGSYTSNGGQQNPNYFGKNKVGFLMMNTTVNNNTNYKDWMIMDCYAGSDTGGAVAFGVNRQSLGAYIMRSASERTSWTESAELLGTHNYNNYALSLSGGTLSGNVTISKESARYIVNNSSGTYKGFFGLSGNDTLGIWSGTYNEWLLTLYNGNIILGQQKKLKVGIWKDTPLYTLDVGGSIGAQTITATEEITAYSDRRLKSNIKPLENRGYIQPMTYIKDNKECIGFIAQDVLEKYPELVNDSGEYLSLNYLQYVAVLQALIIELEKRVKELENGTRKL